MISVKTELLKKTCKSLLESIKGFNDFEYNNIIEISKQKDENVLKFNIISASTYIETRIELEGAEGVEFKAIVSATKFLPLVAKFTTENCELDTSEVVDASGVKKPGNSLTITANGYYTLPLMSGGDDECYLPRLELKNITTEFEVDRHVLEDILLFNTKNITKNNISVPTQKMYYIDEQSCITYNTGACVVDLALPKPIKILLTNSVVKCFSLFTGDKVAVSIAYDDEDRQVVCKIRFADNETSISTILNYDESIIDTVPVVAIKNYINYDYPYLIEFNKKELLNAIDRLTIFKTDVTSSLVLGTFTFINNQQFKLNVGEGNFETLNILKTQKGELEIDKPSFSLDLVTFRHSIEDINSPSIILAFGSNESAEHKSKNVLIASGNIKYILPVMIVANK